MAAKKADGPGVYAPLTWRARRLIAQLRNATHRTVQNAIIQELIHELEKGSRRARATVKPFLDWLEKLSDRAGEKAEQAIGRLPEVARWFHGRSGWGHRGKARCAACPDKVFRNHLEHKAHALKHQRQDAKARKGPSRDQKARQHAKDYLTAAGRIPREPARKPPARRPSATRPTAARPTATRQVAAELKRRAAKARADAAQARNAGPGHAAFADRREAAAKRYDAEVARLGPARAPSANGRAPARTPVNGKPVAARITTPARPLGARDLKAMAKGARTRVNGKAPVKPVTIPRPAPVRVAVQRPAAAPVRAPSVRPLPAATVRPVVARKPRLGRLRLGRAR